MTDEPTREIRLQVEVPGTVEEVWDAIATGPGIATWFVPAEVDPRPGGEILLYDIAPGYTERGRVVAHEAPHRFVYQTGEGERVYAYEWLVEARDGGTSVVRLVQSGFGWGEDWDGEYDAMEQGWQIFLANLVLARTHFAGETAHPIIVGGATASAPSQAWASLAADLEMGEPAVGGRIETAGPILAGTVDRWDGTALTIRLDQPAPGIAFLAAEGSGQEAFVSAYLYLFGRAGAAAAEREGAVWRAWAEQFTPYSAQEEVS